MACLQMVLLFLFIIICYDHAKAATVVCSNTASAKMPFCNKNLHYRVRAQDLINRMTLEEKLAQLGDQAPGVQRLGIPPYNWWSEALHGVSDHGIGVHFDDITTRATLFPAVILTAATFSEPLWKQIGVIVSTEARALHNLGLSGLTFWSPETNIARDPRWGRIQETAGEDPLVVARYVVNYVRGLQDVDRHTNVPDLSTRSLKVAACCKHFTAYDVEKGKFKFNAQVSERDLLETFNYPFEMCVKEGDVASIMCSYNQVNGIPTCADPKLLNQTVKGSWGLHGYIVTACDWVMATVGEQKFINDSPADAIAQAYKAGVDLDCRGSFSPNYFPDAVKQGKLSEADVNRALANLYIVLMRLGWFDGSLGDYANLGRRDVHTGDSYAVAQTVAQQGIVLLQNEMNFLPLNSTGKPTIAVVGPFANATKGMLGSPGNKNADAFHYYPPLLGLSMYANVKYAPGCSDVACTDTKGFQAAIDTAKDAPVTIVCVGLDASVEAENLDRETLFLPANQNKLVWDIVSSGTLKVVVVVFSGGGVDVTDWWKVVAGIIWAGYPGPEGGRPLAQIIYGTASPSGRLPITWYASNYTKKIPANSMQLRPNPGLGYPGRTYRFQRENEDVIYPFGYGLSYAVFNYTITSAPKQVTVASQSCQKIIEKQPSACPAIQVKNSKCQETIKIVVTVTMNNLPHADQVVLLYSEPPNNIAEALPVKRLIEFKRVSVLKGIPVPVEFSVNVCKSFSFVSEDAQELLPAGVHTIVVGNDYTDYLTEADTELGNSVTAAKTTISIGFH